MNHKTAEDSREGMEEGIVAGMKARRDRIGPEEKAEGEGGWKVGPGQGGRMQGPVEAWLSSGVRAWEGGQQ